MHEYTFKGASAWAVVIGFALVCAFVGFCMRGIVSTTTQYIDCGMCGAHVSEWWYVQGADGSPCEVCEYCYQLF